MRINTFFYSIRQGLKNIFRNKMFSLASVATMAACIFMFGLFYIIVTNFSATVHSIEEGVSVTVFFENDAGIMSAKAKRIRNCIFDSSMRIRNIFFFPVRFEYLNLLMIFYFVKNQNRLLQTSVLFLALIILLPHDQHQYNLYLEVMSY